jgi:TRAP-type mannitol/chloroaromatic compound transport system substrate-binding protein
MAGPAITRHDPPFQETMMNAPTDKTPRRKFLSTATAATVGAGALAAPMISRAQTTTLRFQSTWPAKDIFHEYAQDFAKKVNDIAGSRLKIEVLPAGSVVPAFQLLEAVAKGTLDGGHGVVAYHYGKNSALALWGSGPAFGMDPNMVLAWHYYGGGEALLYEIYKTLNLDVKSFLYGPMPTQPLGWFKKPIAKVEDLKGLKYRTVGLAVDVFTELGCAVNPLPGGPRPDRCGRVQQRHQRPHSGLCRCGQELHAAELPPER